MNPYFFYGKIIRYNCNISQDRNKYRIRLTLYYDSGNSYNMQKGGFVTKKQAEKAKDHLITELIHGTFCPFKFKLKEFLEYWLSTLDVAHSTLYSYTKTIQNHLLKSIDENTLLEDISIEMLVKAINEVKSDSTRIHMICVISKSFTYAYQKNYIPLNISLAAIQIAKTKRPIKRKKRNIEWSMDQIKYALYICKMQYPEMFMPFLLSLTIGTRISETIALKYSDIDFTNCIISVSRQLGKSMNENKDIYYGEVKPKTKNGIRKIPLPKWVIDEIIVHRASYEKKKNESSDFFDYDYICCKDNGHPYHRSSMNKWFKSLLKECDFEDIHWHDLRHIYATTLKNSEINIKAISNYMDHSKPTFTESVYIAKEDKINDCTILSHVWNEIQTEEKKSIDIIPNIDLKFFIPKEHEKEKIFIIPNGFEKLLKESPFKEISGSSIYEIPNSIFLCLKSDKNHVLEDFYYDLTIMDSCNII